MKVPDEVRKVVWQKLKAAQTSPRPGAILFFAKTEHTKLKAWEIVMSRNSEHHTCRAAHSTNYWAWFYDPGLRCVEVRLPR